MDGAFASIRLSELLEDFYKYPERLGLTTEEVQGAYLGEAFNLAEIDSNNEAALCSDIKNFPVYYNGDMIAILTMSKIDGELHFSIGQNYAPELQETLDKSNGDIALFVDQKNDLYAIDQSNNKSLVNSDVTTENQSVAIASYASNNSISTLNYANIDISNNVLSKNVNTGTKVSDSIIQRFTTNGYVYSDGTDWYIYPFPEMSQPGTTDCWATTIAAMLRYELPNQYGSITPDQVWQTMNMYRTATLSECLSTMQHYFPAPYDPQIVNSGLPETIVQAITANNDPAFMFLTNREAGVAHATALVGYSYRDNNYKGWLMDPAIGRTTLSDANQNGMYYTNNARTYYWESSIVLYYQ